MSKQVRVLHFTTYDENCGIGKYQAQFLDEMKDSDAVRNDIFPCSPNKSRAMQNRELRKVISKLRSSMKSYDVLHIQYELSFFKGQDLSMVINAAKSVGKKVLVTMHTSPDAQYQPPLRAGFGARSLVRYAKSLRAARNFRSTYINPLKNADLILTHNSTTKDNLVSHGVDINKIKVIQLPVPTVETVVKSGEIRSALKCEDGDIVLATVGFISRMKGVDHAIKCLKFLPDNYKLAIIGGVHPNSSGDTLLDDLCDLISASQLSDRVYITGYIEADDVLNALIRECDICVYPYDTKYYSYVSSAALNNSFANGKPAIVYPTKSFIEINDSVDTVAVTKSANYYELARSVNNISVKDYASKSKLYAKRHSFSNETRKMVSIYLGLV